MTEKSGVSQSGATDYRRFYAEHADDGTPIVVDCGYFPMRIAVDCNTDQQAERVTAFLNECLSVCPNDDCGFPAGHESEHPCGHPYETGARVSSTGYENTRNIQVRTVAALRKLRWCLSLARRCVGLRPLRGRMAPGHPRRGSRLRPARGRAPWIVGAALALYFAYLIALLIWGA